MNVSPSGMTKHSRIMPRCSRSDVMSLHAAQCVKAQALPCRSNGTMSQMICAKRKASQHGP